jgi:hypothetical protein
MVYVCVCVSARACMCIFTLDSQPGTEKVEQQLGLQRENVLQSW